MSRLKGKTIMVTGGASGIGRAAALCCGRDGATVLVVDLDEKGVNQTVADIEASGGRATGSTVDVQDEGQVKALFEEMVGSSGKLDGLVNAAGILEGALVSVDDFEEMTWDRVIDINLKGSFLVSKYAVPLLEKSGQGVMVLISSGAGVRGGSSSVAYGSSKGGVHGLSLVLAQQLADRNIRVHAVCPGSLATPLKLRVVQKQADRAGRTLDEMSEGLGDPEGVGKILAFLVSEDADYLRGTLFTR